jgi:uncharacterized membrane protein YdbT with pleckstrin-like domain
MAYPKRLLSDGEHVQKEFRPHLLAIMKPILLVLGAFAVAIASSALLAGGWVTAGLVVAGLMVLLAVPGLTKWWFTGYVVTNERLIARSGVFRREGKEIPLEVVNDISFKQSFIERIFHSGDLVIESAGEHGQSLFTNVPDPEGLQSEVYRFREARSRDLVSGNSPAEELEKLAFLHRRGVLSREEYERKKEELYNW